jgi:hypothetical protein
VIEVVATVKTRVPELKLNTEGIADPSDYSAMYVKDPQVPRDSVKAVILNVLIVSPTVNV